MRVNLEYRHEKWTRVCGYVFRPPKKLNYIVLSTTAAVIQTSEPRSSILLNSKFNKFSSLEQMRIYCNFSKF